MIEAKVESLDLFGRKLGPGRYLLTHPEARFVTKGWSQAVLGCSTKVAFSCSKEINQLGVHDVPVRLDLLFLEVPILVQKKTSANMETNQSVYLTKPT